MPSKIHSIYNNVHVSWIKSYITSSWPTSLTVVDKISFAKKMSARQETHYTNTYLSFHKLGEEEQFGANT